jgi:hypothetical protein
MRLYSVYEIEKLSKGRLSKYRLLQAIKEGLLSATPMATMRRGRGSPKFLISSDDLKVYLEKLKADLRRVDTLSNDAINDILLAVSLDPTAVVSESDVTVDMLIRRLHALEEKNEAMEPLVRQGLRWMTDEKEKKARRQELLAALAATEWYEFEKRKALVEQLTIVS